jgi:hypothetical protein
MIQIQNTVCVPAKTKPKKNIGSFFFIGLTKNRNISYLKTISIQLNELKLKLSIEMIK